MGRSARSSTRLRSSGLGTGRAVLAHLPVRLDRPPDRGGGRHAAARPRRCIGPCGHCSWSWPVPTSGPETSTCSWPSGRAGLTSPIAWAGLALTKVTPGVGALWHGFRGRWPEFGLASASRWSGRACRSSPPRRCGRLAVDRARREPAGPVPNLGSGPACPSLIALLWWAARTDRPWLVPIACMAALPVIWFNGLSMLLGAAALIDHRTARFHPGQSAGLRSHKGGLIHECTTGDMPRSRFCPACCSSRPAAVRARALRGVERRSM